VSVGIGCDLVAAVLDEKPPGSVSLALAAGGWRLAAGGWRLAAGG